MHAGNRNNVQKARSVHGKIQALILIEILLVAQHERFHKSGGIRREKPFYLRSDLLLQPERKIPESDLSGDPFRRRFGISSQINAPGQIGIIALSVALIRAFQAGRAAKHIAGRKGGERITISVKNNLPPGKIAAIQTDLHSGVVLKDLRIGADLTPDVYGLPIQGECRTKGKLLTQEKEQKAEG